MNKNDKKIVFAQLMHFISNVLPLYFQKIKHFTIKEYAELFRVDIILSYENSTRTELARFFVSDETSIEIQLEIPCFNDELFSDLLKALDSFFERTTPFTTASYLLTGKDYYILTPKENYQSLFKDLYIPVDTDSYTLPLNQEITGIRAYKHTVLSVLEELKKEKLNHKIVICSIVDNNLDHLEQKTPIYDMNTLPFTGVSSFLDSKIINVMQMKDPFKESVLNILIISGAENNE